MTAVDIEVPQATAHDATVVDLLANPHYEVPAEPGEVLRRLARVGDRIEQEPQLLGLRARCHKLLGRAEDALRDVQHALALTDDGALRRWLIMLRAQCLLHVKGEDPKMRVMGALPEGVADLAASAYGLRVLAEAAAADEEGDGLERADRLLQTSMRLWQRCGSPDNLRWTRSVRATDVLQRQQRHAEEVEEFDAILADRRITVDESGWIRLLRGFAYVYAGRFDDAEADFAAAERMARDPLSPLRISTVAWGRAVAAARVGNRDEAQRQALRAENVATVIDSRLSVRCLCELSMAFARLGDCERAEAYLARARTAPGMHPRYVEVATRELDERRALPPVAVITPRSATITMLRVFGPRITLIDSNGDTVNVDRRQPRALLALIAANGGTVDVSTVLEALWPDASPEQSRTWLRQVLCRLRPLGNMRHGQTLRLPKDVTCDLIEFERLACIAKVNMRNDPDRAAEAAFEAVVLAGAGTALAAFTDEWADEARYRVGGLLTGMLDFLAIRARDAGDHDLADQWSRKIASYT